MSQINIRVNELTKQRMENAAASRGLNLSSWLKMLAMDEMDKRDIAVPTAAKTKPVLSDYAPNMNTHGDEIIDIIRDIKEAGHSASAIADELNNRGYLSASLVKFNKGAVEGIIRRKI